MTRSGPTLHAVAEAAAADWITWQDPARGTFVAVVAKIALGFAPGDVCALLPPVDLTTNDRHRERSPLREVEVPSDAAPFLATPEILIVGHAYGPAGRSTPSLAVHVALGRDAVTFRKMIHVYGDRDGPGAVPTPFRRMPLSWERSVRSDVNPVGVDPASQQPNLVDPIDATVAAGCGPLGAGWPSRRALLGIARRSDLEAEPMTLPAGFDGSWFQAAPPDQWLPGLVGDEWVSLDGLHPSLPRVQTKLPGLRVGARIEGPRGGRTLELRPDRLLIDTDRQRATLTYRGSQAVDPADLATTRIFVGFAAPGSPVAWPDASDASTWRPHVFGRSPAPSLAPPLDETTATLDAVRLPRMATPLDAPPQQPPAATTGAVVPVAYGPDATDDDDTASGGTLVADVAGKLSAARALSFAGAPQPAAPAVARPVIDDEDTAGTAVIDVAAALGKPSGVQGTPFVAPPTDAPPSREPATLPLPNLAPPPFIAPTPFIAPPALVAPPAMVGGEIFTEETAFEESTRHPAEALPFAPAVARAPGPPTAAATGGLPFADAPHVGPLPAPPSVDFGDAAPVVPEPRGDTVPTLTDAPVHLVTVPWQIQPPKDSLTVIVKGSFRLVDDGPAVALPEAALPMGDVFAEDEPEKQLLHASDFAVMKPQCDVLVVGSAHAPGGAAKAMQLLVRVKGAHGRVERQLTVFGDRTWQRALVAVAPSDPAPFASIPIGWDRAFGGLDFAANPHGVGYRARAGADGVLRLPNFETPGQHIRSPDDVPPPASYAPVHPQWKARWSLLGTYDRAWFHERWPYFPRDFDYHFFQAAPQGQRLEKAVGDEEYELVGLVPGKPKLKGRLAGVKMRVFARKTAEAGGTLVEVPVKLDTITFFTEDSRVDLVWRGWVDVSDDDAPELERLFATAEPTAGPAMTAAEIEQRYQAALNPPEEEEPIAHPPPPPAAEEEQQQQDDEPPARDVEGEMAAMEKELLAELQARGIAIEPGAQQQPPDPRKLADSLRAAGAGEEDVADVMAALAPPPEDVDTVAAPPVDKRRLVEERMARGEPLADLDLRKADLRDLDLSAQDLRASDLSDALLSRANLARADLSGAILMRADLEDVRCEGARLVGADLTRAVIDGARFDGACLDEATLARVRGSKVSLREASAVGAGFVGAKLPRAHLEGSILTGADFTEAELDDAVFDGAQMAKVRLYKARGHNTSFARCDMPNARCEGAVFEHATFRGVVADDSVWERADVTTCTFQGASLVSCSFVRARCWKTNFNEADLSTARLRKSHMNGATFVKANLMEASMEGADFELADLRGSNLHGATMTKAKLKHAKLDHAITSYTALSRKQP